MQWESLKAPLTKFGLWALRTLIREGKEEVAKFAVDEVLKDERIPTVNDIGTFVRKNFGTRVGRRSS